MLCFGKMLQSVGSSLPGNTLTPFRSVFSGKDDSKIDHHQIPNTNNITTSKSIMLLHTYLFYILTNILGIEKMFQLVGSSLPENTST